MCHRPRIRITTAVQARAKAAQMRHRASGRSRGLLRDFYLRLAAAWDQRARDIEARPE